jgi:hypothetical protein
LRKAVLVGAWPLVALEDKDFVMGTSSSEGELDKGHSHPVAQNAEDIMEEQSYHFELLRTLF